MKTLDLILKRLAEGGVNVLAMVLGGDKGRDVQLVIGLTGKRTSGNDLMKLVGILDRLGVTFEERIVTEVRAPAEIVGVYHRITQALLAEHVRVYNFYQTEVGNIIIDSSDPTKVSRILEDL